MSDHWKKPAICWQTDPDEAFLVGTKESFAELAKLLMALVEDDTNFYKQDVNGVTLKSVYSSGSLTEYGLDTVIQGISIVDEAKDVLKIVNYFRQLNGNLPLVEGSGNA